VKWFDETLHEHIIQSFRVSKILHRQKTEFQDLIIFETPLHGRVLALDGVIQTTEADEFIYHEMLAHLPLLAHGRVRRVLIIGGGDGGMLEEVLKHPVEKVTMVELDPGVVELARKYLSSICGDAFDDPRADLVFADGAKLVAETDVRYDLIIVDSTDPIGPGEILFGRAFYADCKRCLNPGGILVTQNGVPFLQGGEVTSSYGHFRELFPDATMYLATVPTYFGGPMAFGWASLDPAHRRHDLATIAARYSAAGIETRYYNPETHLAAFALPNYVKALMT
jgi:spermidine synthase